MVAGVHSGFTNAIIDKHGNEIAVFWFKGSVYKLDIRKAGVWAGCGMVGLAAWCEQW